MHDGSELDHAEKLVITLKALSILKERDARLSSTSIAAATTKNNEGFDRTRKMDPVSPATKENGSRNGRETREVSSEGSNSRGRDSHPHRGREETRGREISSRSSIIARGRSSKSRSSSRHNSRSESRRARSPSIVRKATEENKESALMRHVRALPHAAAISFEIFQ